MSMCSKSTDIRIHTFTLGHVVLVARWAVSDTEVTVENCGGPSSGLLSARCHCAPPCCICACLCTRARASRPNTLPNLATRPPRHMTSLQFWKPGTAGPGSSLDRATETEENVIQSAPSSGYLGIQGARERLPIFKHRASRMLGLRRVGTLTSLTQERNCCIAWRDTVWLL